MAGFLETSPVACGDALFLDELLTLRRSVLSASCPPAGTNASLAEYATPRGLEAGHCESVAWASASTPTLEEPCMRPPPVPLAPDVQWT
jgi:hypothetical protein